MLLKDLQVGKRFVFEDRKTPLAVAHSHGQYTPDGTFELVRFGESGCPVLRSYRNGKVITMVAGTIHRSVLIIL